MTELIVNNAQSISFGLLFTCLLYWTVQENKRREENYEVTIAENQMIIQEQMQCIVGLSRDVTEIKALIAKMQKYINKRGE